MRYFSGPNSQIIDRMSAEHNRHSLVQIRKLLIECLRNITAIHKCMLF